MFTSPDNSTLLIAQSALGVMSEGCEAFGIDHKIEDDLCESPTLDYKDIAAQAEKMSDLADQYGKRDFFRKASDLHTDAAAEAGVSTGTNLYSRNELYHMTKAKYYSLRLSGDTADEAQKKADDMYTQLARHKRHIVVQD